MCLGLSYAPTVCSVQRCWRYGAKIKDRAGMSPMWNPEFSESCSCNSAARCCWVLPGVALLVCVSIPFGSRRLLVQVFEAPTPVLTYSLLIIGLWSSLRSLLPVSRRHVPGMWCWCKKQQLNLGSDWDIWKQTMGKIIIERKRWKGQK